MQSLERALAALVLGTAVTAAAPAPRVLDARAAYPEGPLIVAGEGALVAEMGADRVSLYGRDGAKRTFFRDPGCGPTAVAPYGNGFIILCHLRGGVAIVDAEGALRGRIEDLGNPNDGFADGAGGVYISSPGPFSKGSEPQGRILHIASDGTARAVAGPLWYPNGVYVDARSRSAFVSEHLARRILRFPIREDGTFGPAAVFAEIDRIAPKPTAPLYREAGPDGLEMAPNGDLVVAIYGEGRYLQLTPEGRLRRVIEAPAQFVTNIAFDADGSAVLTAPRVNDTPPFPGVVARLPASAFAVR